MSEARDDSVQIMNVPFNQTQNTPYEQMRGTPDISYARIDQSSEGNNPVIVQKFKSKPP
jgi:flagellar biosynthesis/type III secretory pathway M-ring protein FliF/YscJ